MKRIPLTEGFFAIIDDEDCEAKGPSPEAFDPTSCRSIFLSLCHPSNFSQATRPEYRSPSSGSGPSFGGFEVICTSPRTTATMYSSMLFHPAI